MVFSCCSSCETVWVVAVTGGSMGLVVGVRPVPMDVEQIDVSRVHRSRKRPAGPEATIRRSDTARRGPYEGRFITIRSNSVGDGGGPCQRFRIEKEDGADDVGGG